MRSEFFDRFFGHSHFHPRGGDRGGRGMGRGGRGMGRGGRDHHHHPHHGEHGHHRHGERDGEHLAIKRLLAHGDLRYIALLLIEAKPRHGYEIIKLIETKSSGQYVPSPGVIYPTLTYLEDMGLVTTSDQGGKKQYSITPEGVAHLDENRKMTVGILERLEEMGARMASAKAEAGEGFDEGDMADMRMVFMNIRRELMAAAPIAVKTRKRIVEALQGALVEIQKILSEGK